MAWQIIFFGVRRTMSNRLLFSCRLAAASMLALALAACANNLASQGAQDGSAQYPPASPDAAQNFLRKGHETRLARAIQDQTRATSPRDKAEATRKVAAQLDSLGRSDEALRQIDQALTLVEAGGKKDFVATKAAILFSMNDPAGAMRLLAPQIEQIRTLAAANAKQKEIYLSIFSQGFLTATFAQMQQEQWAGALNTLADAHSPLEGASFVAYKSLLYRYIMARANDPSLTNADLESSAKLYAVRDKTQYGALLRMWQGEDTSGDLRAILARKSGADRQEALSEVLFHTGAFERFVRNDPEAGRQTLARLNQLAPYGSVEWIYGRRILQ
ncbi:hypothetical protein ABE485_02005 [Achromobacter spanius]|uniref:hypothetical protein n=1 Tax=Achromobacter spanius TaxID=217203 RepID=UPI00320B4CFF